MKKSYLLLLLCLLSLSMSAVPSFDSQARYRIATAWNMTSTTSGAITLGANYGQASTLYYLTAPTSASWDKDCFWHIRQTERGFLIYNDETSQYLTYTPTYTEREKYLMLTSVPSANAYLGDCRGRQRRVRHHQQGAAAILFRRPHGQLARGTVRLGAQRAGERAFPFL